MWNDDTRIDTYLLYPICETSIPQARPGGIRSWGSGNSHTINIKVCVDADDCKYTRTLQLLVICASILTECL